MPDVHHIAVFHDVLLAFQAQRAAGASFGFRPCIEQLVPVNGFGTDEMMFQISVDSAGPVPQVRVLRLDANPGYAAVEISCAAPEAPPPDATACNSFVQKIRLMPGNESKPASKLSICAMSCCSITDTCTASRAESRR
jgi:hypothetical protein